MGAFVDLTGCTFGRWTVVSFDRIYKKRTYWRCVCSCGTKKSVDAAGLVHGRSTSCGCYNRSVVTKHGEATKRTPEYMAWGSMLSRCYNKKHHAYRLYGGAGIIVCARWRHSYEAFLADVGRRPSSKHSLERKNGPLGYRPTNVVWATSETQTNNRPTFNRVISARGQKATIGQWARKTGIPYATIYGRLTAGCSPEKALTVGRIDRKSR